PWLPTYPTWIEAFDQSACCRLMLHCSTYGVRRFLATPRMSHGVPPRFGSQLAWTLNIGPAALQFNVPPGWVVAAATMLPLMFDPMAPVGITLIPGVVALLTPFCPRNIASIGIS